MWVLVEDRDDEKRLVFGRLDNQPIVVQFLATLYKLAAEGRRYLLPGMGKIWISRNLPQQTPNNRLQISKITCAKHESSGTSFIISPYSTPMRALVARPGVERRLDTRCA
jgi:hypothetical protein